MYMTCTRGNPSLKVSEVYEELLSIIINYHHRYGMSYKNRRKIRELKFKMRVTGMNAMQIEFKKPHNNVLQKYRLDYRM